MGMAGTAFGRNVPPRMTTPRNVLATPNPRDISNLLLARDEFVPAGIVNVLAAAWLQFMNHNWFFHERGPEDDFFEVPLPAGDTWPDKHMRIRKTPTMPGASRTGHGGSAPAFHNQESHWWDGSQIYGTGKDRQQSLRTFEDGQIKIETTNGTALRAVSAAMKFCSETATKLPVGGHEFCPLTVMGSARHDVVCLTGSHG